MEISGKKTSTQLAIEAFKSGISDYIVKDDGRIYLEHLPRILVRVLEQYEDKEHRKKAEEQKEIYCKELHRTNKELTLKQEELIQATRSVSCGIIASGVAHDFNNILTQILGFTEIAEDKDDLESIREDLAIVKEQVVKAAELTGSLLKIGRKTAQLEKSCINIANVIDGGLGILKNQFFTKGIEVKVNFPPRRLPLTAGDEGQLQNVIQNLALNAMHAMEERMARESGEGKSSKMQFTVNVEVKGKEVEIEVVDTGKGIPPENIGQIYVPFFTTKEQTNIKGTGLGLAMVFATIKNHDGRIDVKSYTSEMIAKDPKLEGQTPGTIFRVTLPITELPEEITG